MDTELDVDGSVLILDEATVAGAGPSHTMTGGGVETLEAYGTTSEGRGSAIIQIQVSNDGSTWQTAGTISLDLETNRTSNRLTMDSAWSGWTYIRSNLKSISGTGASVSVYKNDVISKGLAAELAAISAPVPLWVCGMPFVLFAGDGGANGMLFTGTAGGFTLSAAVLTGFVIPVGYCYLPANAGGLGNEAGWFYFEMSSTTAGTVYNNGFTPTPGGLPVVPASKTAFANPAGGRITQTTADITMLSCSLAAGELGAHGLLKAGVKMIGTSSGATKIVKLIADATVIHTISPSTNPCIDYEFVTQNAGSLEYQISTRWFGSIGDVQSSISGDLSSFNFSNASTLSISARITSNAETLLTVPRYLNMQKKA